MVLWTFYDFIESSGRAPFCEWLACQPDEPQAFIDARILQMRGLAKWPEKWISKYRGTRKIFELRVSFQKMEYRPLGCYAPGRSFILLAGAIEQNWKLPADTIASAVRRQALLEEEPHHVREHRFN